MPDAEFLDYVYDLIKADPLRGLFIAFLWVGLHFLLKSPDDTLIKKTIEANERLVEQIEKERQENKEMAEFLRSQIETLNNERNQLGGYDK